MEKEIEKRTALRSAGNLTPEERQDVASPGSIADAVEGMIGNIEDSIEGRPVGTKKERQ